MSEITIRVPDYLRRQAEILAQREMTTLDHFVSLALASHVTSRLEKNYLETLAARDGLENLKTAIYSPPQVAAQPTATR